MQGGINSSNLIKHELLKLSIDIRMNNILKTCSNENHKRRFGKPIILISICFSVFVFSQSFNRDQSVHEIAVVQIPLRGEAGERRAEFSGLAWYKKFLVLLPQYPSRYGDHFYVIHQDTLQNFLHGKHLKPITPDLVPVHMPDFSSLIPGYEGFEAIGFLGDQVFLTIESESDEGIMGYLISGTVLQEMQGISLDIHSLTEIRPQTELPNFSEESLLIAGDRIATIYEINGLSLNKNPLMHVFSVKDLSETVIPFPSIEYRITDATELDKHNRFWVINYLWPGDADDLRIGEDPLFLEYGIGPAHQKSEAVERLIELEFTDKGVLLTDTPPILLELEKDQSRNWEGIVRFQNEGFLLVTDKFPKTLLVFVPYLNKE